MTLKIVIKNAAEALDLKAQVDQFCGPNDFAWRYTPAVNDWFGAEQLTPGTAEFEFVDKKWETYFQLKWGV
jgi:hypothetical protein